VVRRILIYVHPQNLTRYRVWPVAKHYFSPVGSSGFRGGRAGSPPWATYWRRHCTDKWQF